MLAATIRAAFLAIAIGRAANAQIACFVRQAADAVAIGLRIGTFAKACNARLSRRAAIAANSAAAIVAAFKRFALIIRAIGGAAGFQSGVRADIARRAACIAASAVAACRIAITLTGIAPFAVLLVAFAAGAAAQIRAAFLFVAIGRTTSAIVTSLALIATSARAARMPDIANALVIFAAPIVAALAAAIRIAATIIAAFSAFAHAKRRAAIAARIADLALRTTGAGAFGVETFTEVFLGAGFIGGASSARASAAIVTAGFPNAIRLASANAAFIAVFTRRAGSAASAAAVVAAFFAGAIR